MHIQMQMPLSVPTGTVVCGHSDALMSSRRCNYLFVCWQLTYMMSMLGGPRVILMDEPSTGMDPVSRLFLWDTVLAVFNGSSRRGCLVTTHHMEEADALCSTVAIMVNGDIKLVVVVVVLEAAAAKIQLFRTSDILLQKTSEMFKCTPCPDKKVPSYFLL